MTIDVPGDALWIPLDLKPNADCYVVDKYGQTIAEGLGVTLKDGLGRTLAETTLGSPAFDGTSCSWPFDFKAVPVRSYYTVHLGPLDVAGMTETGPAPGTIHYLIDD